MNSQKGGTQGIPQGVDVNTFLPEFAGADFKHDFGGDKITLNVLNDIETVGDRSTFIQTLTPYIGQSAFDAFHKNFPLSIPAAREVKFKLEEALLQENGIAYDKELGTAVYSRKELPTTIAQQIPRNYTMNIALEKVKRKALGTAYESQLKQAVPGIQYVNLLSCLWAVSGVAGQRKKTFVIMYDAGNCATSEISDFSKPSISDILEDPIGVLGETFDPTLQYEVYFVNNSENVRDPAPKITEQTFKNLPGNVAVYFLKDYGHKVRYDIYTQSTSGTETSNLYSNYSITTNRETTGNKVRATLDFQDGSSIQLDDLKRESEIGSSITNAMSMFLKNKGVVDEKLMSCFFLKRSGDWCQALSLLDKQRKYTVEGYGPRANQGIVTTLQELEDDGGEIMLMTHDRILLVYSLALGINVLFTNNRPSGHWLIYFKNMDVFRIDDYPKLVSDGYEFLSAITRLQDTANAVRQDASTEVSTTPWFPLSNIAILRKSFTIQANLPSDETIGATITTLQTLLTDVEKYEDVYKYFAGGGTLEALSDEDKQRAKDFSDTLGKLRNALPNIQSTMDILNKYIGKFTYPNQEEEALTLGPDFDMILEQQKSLKGSYKSTDGRTFNLEASFVLIAERLADDVMGSGGTLEFPSDGDIPELAQQTYPILKERITRTQIGLFRGIVDIFYKAYRKKSAKQVGGVSEASDAYFVTNAMNLLTEIAIPVNEYTPGDAWGFTLGEKFIHYDRWQYTIVDPYIVTKENGSSIYGALVGATQLTQEVTNELYPLPYLTILLVRLLILYVDILDNEYRLVEDALNSYSEKQDEFDYTTPEQITLSILSLKTEKINQIVTSIESPYDFDEIVSMLMSYENENLDGVNPTKVTIDSLRKRLVNMYIETFKDYMGTLRSLEDQGLQLQEENPNFVVLFNPANAEYSIHTYTPETAKFIGDRQLQLVGMTPEYWQNIATNVYVPLIPQPTSLPAFGNRSVGQPVAGGLRSRRPLYANVRIPSSSTLQHKGLRKRTRTRRATRVRQSTHKSKSRR